MKLVPKSNDYAIQIARDIHSSLNNNPIALKQFGVNEKVTSSIGVAIGVRNRLTSINAADLALYIAKALGRNRVFDLEQLTQKIAKQTTDYLDKEIYTAKQNLKSIYASIKSGHSTLEAEKPAIECWTESKEKMEKILEKFGEILEFREKHSYNIIYGEEGSDENINRVRSTQTSNIKTNRELYSGFGADGGIRQSIEEENRISSTGGIPGLQGAEVQASVNQSSEQSELPTDIKDLLKEVDRGLKEPQKI